MPAPGAEFLRYGGHTPCLAIAHDEEDAPRLVLDAGTGLTGVTALLGERPFTGSILLTHLHWDHVQGLPFFAAAERDGGRATVFMPDQQTGADPVSVLARLMSPPTFPVTPNELSGSWSYEALAPGGCEREGLTVLAREVPHKGGRTFGYRIGDGRSTLAYLPDHCPTALGPGPDGVGEYHETALELAAGVDLLIHDAQIMPGELAADGIYGHAVTDYAIALGRRAGARRVLLFHHRYDRTDVALDELAERHAGESDVAVAVQGSSIEL
jgi:ribonuclease BN (tRNA processing enzyme)